APPPSSIVPAGPTSALSAASLEPSSAKSRNRGPSSGRRSSLSDRHLALATSAKARFTTPTTCAASAGGRREDCDKILRAGSALYAVRAVGWRLWIACHRRSPP